MGQSLPVPDVLQSYITLHSTLCLAEYGCTLRVRNVSCMWTERPRNGTSGLSVCSRAFQEAFGAVSNTGKKYIRGILDTLTLSVNTFKSECGKAH